MSIFLSLSVLGSVILSRVAVRGCARYGGSKRTVLVWMVLSGGCWAGPC